MYTIKARMAKAAAAAKQFQGFDHMAENDDYVNSNGLNVKKDEKPKHDHSAALKEQKSSNLSDLLQPKKPNPPSLPRPESTSSQPMTGTTCSQQQTSLHLSAQQNCIASSLDENYATATLFESESDNERKSALKSPSLKAEAARRALPEKEWSLLDDVMLFSSSTGAKKLHYSSSSNRHHPLTVSHIKNVGTVAGNERLGLKRWEGLQAKSGDKPSYMLSAVAALMQESDRRDQEQSQIASTSSALSTTLSQTPQFSTSTVILTDAKKNKVLPLEFDYRTGLEQDDDLEEDSGHGYRYKGGVCSVHRQTLKSHDSSRKTSSSDILTSSSDESVTFNPEILTSKGQKMISQAKEKKIENQISRNTSRNISRQASRNVSSTVTPTSSAEETEPIVHEKKDPYRFMTDLDERLSKSIVRMPTAPIGNLIKSNSMVDIRAQLPLLRNNNHFFSTEPAQVEHNEENGLALGQPEQRQSMFGSFSESKNKMEWWRKIAAPKIQSITQKFPGKWREVELEETNSFMSKNYIDSDNSNKDKFLLRKQQLGSLPEAERVGVIAEDGFNVVVTSAVLAADEHAELERLMLNTKASPFSAVCSLATRNGHFLFIALTLVLMLLAYFLTRKKTEDGVM